MLSSNLNKQAQSGSPEAQTQLLSNWTNAAVPSATLSNGNVLPISNDETGNNWKLDIPGIARAALCPELMSNRGSRASRTRVSVHLCRINPNIHVNQIMLCLISVKIDKPEEIAIEPRAVVEGDNVNLTCRATRYLYTHLQWLDSRNETITTNVSSIQIGNYSISLSLRLHNVSQMSTAGYRCQAHKLYKGVQLRDAALTVDGEFKKMFMRS